MIFPLASFSRCAMDGVARTEDNHETPRFAGREPRGGPLFVLFGAHPMPCPASVSLGGFMSTENGLPYICVWASDTLAYIFKTGESPTVTGARLRLWLVACEEDPVGTLPNDIAQLETWSGLDAGAMQEHYPSITGGWKLDGDRWQIRRIQEQFAEVEGRREQGRKAAKSRWSKKKGRHAAAMPKQCVSNADAMQEQCPPTPTPSPAPSPIPTQSLSPTPIPPVRADGPEPSEVPDRSTFDRYWISCGKSEAAKTRALEEWPSFLTFWEAHPNKTGKLKAWQAWLKLKPPLEACLTVLRWQREDPHLSRENYRYIPRPQAWINAASWDDCRPDMPPPNEEDISPNLRGFYNLLKKRAERKRKESATEVHEL